MRERVEAFHQTNSTKTVGPEHQKDDAAGPRAISPVQADAPQAREHATQTLVEFDPVTDQFSWADIAAARRLIGGSLISDETTGATTDRSAFESRIVGEPDDARTRAYQGAVESYVCEYQLQRDGEDACWVEERGGWIGSGAERRLISVIRSIDTEKQYEERLSWLARNDELTGLLNRTNLRARIDDWMAARENAGALGSGTTAQSGAYILVGIDDLGSVNADFGFEVADELIVAIAARIRETIAATDFAGRVAGTKFGILIADADESEIRDMCVKLLNCVREKVVNTKRGGIAASVCIGAVALPGDADTSQKAMSRAEAALDQARRLGHSSWSAFSEKTDQISQRRRNKHMSDVILTALNERRIRLAFQPIVSDLGEAPTKYECLIRMRGEDGRQVPAPEFIPVAERLGLVHLLDRRVLELAINTLAICPNVHLAVNVSMETVKDPVWAEGYLAHMRAHEALARRITVELTETQVIDAVDASIEFVSEIKELNASFAIDDFGAGYTSFRYLKALDIDSLKIDGSFVTGVAASRENQLFVRTLLDLARNFGMKTVAEWVDNEADAMLLKGLGVDYLQGFLLGKPEVNPSWLPDGAPNTPPVQTTEFGSL